MQCDDTLTVIGHRLLVGERNLAGHTQRMVALLIDGLCYGAPKHKNFPSEMGGSGVLLPE